MVLDHQCFLRIVLRADSGFAREELMVWCEANDVHFLFGLQQNERLVAEVAGELARAEDLMSAMDEIYSLLVTIDYPDGVTGGLRRTTDALRAVLERTRGDLTTTLIQQRLLDALERRLPE